jgi:hypothetical protein
LVLSLDGFEGIVSAPFVRQDDLGRLGPHERLRICVAMQEVVISNSATLTKAPRRIRFRLVELFFAEITPAHGAAGCAAADWMLHVIS